MNFEALVETIAEIHRSTHRAATRAVNAALTCRNWLIGAYIHEYELQGQDRADYGARLFEQLEKRLGDLGVPNCNRSRLYRYRDFYRLYPHIQTALSASYSRLLPTDISEPIVATPSPLSGDLILERLSYSHIELLLEMADSLKRAFYEVECVKGGWSVRELKRQTASLYFERSGLSRDKTALAKLTQAGVQRSEPNLAIRNP